MAKNYKIKQSLSRNEACENLLSAIGMSRNIKQMRETKCNGLNCLIKNNCRYFIMHALQEQYCCGEVDARRIDAKFKDGKCPNYFALLNELKTEELVEKLPRTIEQEDGVWRLRVNDKECEVAYSVDYRGEDYDTFVCYGRSMRYAVLKTLSWLWNEGYIDERI